jgi:uncharacterized SAM-binding protein YcdF (DUF218 family)
LPVPKQFPEAEDGSYPREEAITKEVLLARGVGEADIVFLPGRVCEHTGDEARSLGEFLDAHPGARVAVVTNSFHTKRAKWIFEKTIGDKVEGLLFFGAPTDGFDESNWWHYRRGVVMYSNEYMKLVLECFSR